MQFLGGIWAGITYVFNVFTLSPTPWSEGLDQFPISKVNDGPFGELLKGPSFKPPTGRPEGPGSDFTCEYPEMTGWSPCSTPDNRGCWLRNGKTGEEYNITTDYENITTTPIGIERRYVLDLTDESLNLDGLDFPEAKIFNKQYPGPWIQACWGDTVTVTVNNRLKFNGTSIHWHGIRQLLNMHNDGVPGITQCPIAPGDSYTYSWKVMQYGSSWLHSHFSVQYQDGAVGPMTLHGPSSAGYDEAKFPILMTDWGHVSAFQGFLQNPSILLNGIGNVTAYNNSVPAKRPVKTPYTINFDPPPKKGSPKRYLLRIINTSFESTFVFSIDNHLLEIVGADFVPIQPYKNTSVLVGIGQRYHVIVTADPDAPSNDGNYWIRTWRANCFVFPAGSPGYEKTGILRYGDSKALPTTKPWNNVSLACSDETYESLHPIRPWTVGKPSNDPSGSIGENLTVQFKPNQGSIFPLARFSMGGDDFNPMRITWGNPTFLNLNFTGKWNPLWVVFPESYTEKDWVYLVLHGLKGTTTGSHPIHLHGHDFAILQQIGNATFPNKLHLKLDNPPRRDVVLLPTDGYVVMAFKTDNPGSWIMHCHIASHASWGLAAQILERQEAAANQWPDLQHSKALQQVQQGCNNWNKWWGDCTNWYPGHGESCLIGENAFSPDSGI